MENLAALKSVAPDLPPTLTTETGVSPPRETLAPTEGNAVDESPFAAGDFVWAKSKGHPWWPALVSDPPESAEKAKGKRHSVLVACFGEEDTLAWCEPKQLKPFLRVFDEMVRQSSSKSFLGAVDNCIEEVGRSLELEFTCCCMPVEDRQKQMRRDTCRKLPVANYPPQEFLDCVADVAMDVQAVNALQVIRLRSWVFAFGKVSLQGECCQRLRIEELVDKIDLDDLPSEFVNGNEEKEGLITASEAVKGPRVITGKLQQAKKKRSMAKLIAEMDLDALEIINGKEKDEQILRSKKRKKKGNADVVKAEDGAGSSSGRRARKKSKYLSPPYTVVVQESITRSLKKKTARKADHRASGSSEIFKCTNMEDEYKWLMLKIERMPAQEIFSEFVAVAENILYLKCNLAAKIVKGFFAMHRISGCSGGVEFDVYQKLLHVSTKNQDKCNKAGKLQRNGKKRNLEPNQKSDLYFEQHGSKEYLAGCEIELDCKQTTEAEQEDDFEFNQQKSDHSEEQKCRKKMSKDVTNQGALVNSDHCLADASDKGNKKQMSSRMKMTKDATGLGACIVLDLSIGDISGEGKNKQKSTSKKKMSKNGTSQGAPVSSGPQLADASNEGREKQKPAWKKMSAYGIGREALAQYDLHDADPSHESKLGQSRKRSQNDANGDVAVDVALHKVNNFHENSSEKKERISKDFVNVSIVSDLTAEAINCQKPVLVDEKKIERKEDAKLPVGGKSGHKKKKNSNDRPKPNSFQRKGNDAETSLASQAALQLTFHSGFVLPSIDDLITTYSKYGALIENQMKLFNESNSAHVMFAKSTDAENAFKDNAGPYRSIATYRLHYIPKNLITKPNAYPVSLSQPIPDVVSPLKQLPNVNSASCKLPLPYIRKSLETMISSLACSPIVSNAGSSSDGLKPGARENLVGEMQGLLQKVEKILNGAGSSSAT